MSTPKPRSPIGRIELDLDSRPFTARRTAPSSNHQNSHFEMPKIYPVLDSSVLGSDQTQRTVALLILMNAIFEFIVLGSGHGNPSNLIAIPASLILGVLLFRGSEFIQKLCLYYYIFQLGVGIIFFLLTMGAGSIFIVFMLLNIMSIVGMIYLLSGDAISRKKYIFCIAFIMIGKAISSLGSFSR